MFAFAILAAAAIHEPTPADVHRFGFLVRPVSDSPPRAGWNAARERLYDLSQPVSGWIAYGRESQIADSLVDQRWREPVWDAADDLARECASVECRQFAARRLRGLIGPVSYWLGEMPAPVP